MPDSPVNGPDTALYLRDVSEQVEAFIKDSGLTPVSIPTVYENARGRVGDIDVDMNSRRFEGSGLQSLTVAYLRHHHTKQLLSVTVSGIPRADTGLPILGLDYVGFRGTLSLVALDLCPVEQHLWTTRVQPIMRPLHTRAKAHLIQRKIPGFTEGVFSELAVFAAATREDHCQHSVEMSEILLSEYKNLLQSCSQNPAQAKHNHERIQTWKRAMQNNKKEHSALSRIFGVDFTEKYLRQFLFLPEVYRAVDLP